MFIVPRGSPHSFNIIHSWCVRGMEWLLHSLLLAGQKRFPSKLNRSSILFHFSPSIFTPFNQKLYTVLQITWYIGKVDPHLTGQLGAWGGSSLHQGLSQPANIPEDASSLAVFYQVIKKFRFSPPRWQTITFTTWVAHYPAGTNMLLRSAKLFCLLRQHPASDLNTKASSINTCVFLQCISKLYIAKRAGEAGSRSYSRVFC